MTLSSLADRDIKADSEPIEPELSRVTVMVGGLQLDVGLPVDAIVGAVAEDVIELANGQLTGQPEQPEIAFDTTQGKWTLARLGSEPLDPDRPLADFNIGDGEVLVICDVETPCAPILFDDIDAIAEVSDEHRAPGSEFLRPMTGCFAVALVASVTAALLLARQSTTAATATALAAGAIGAVAAGIAGYRNAVAAASPWLAAAAIPLIFAGSLGMVSTGAAASSLPMAFALTGFVALMAALTSSRGRSFYTAIVGVAVFGTAAGVWVLLWAPAERTVGAIFATLSVIVVYLAPRATIVLSKLPLPRVPTAGEPLDDIETQGGTAVEGVNAVGKQVIPTEQGLIERVRPSNQYLTGIVVAATITAVAGSYLAVDVSNGFFWQGIAFAVVVACVLCLRGRSHYDVAQSATLIGGGLLAGFALITKTAVYLDDWRVNAALGLIVMTGLVVACGLVAPRVTFSPVMQRQAEILEYLAIATLFPLCFWIIRLYAFFRELRL
jgi:type VII secretion integral membrane protein EccD